MERSIWICLWFYLHDQGKLHQDWEGATSLLFLVAERRHSRWLSLSDNSGLSLEASREQISQTKLPSALIQPKNGQKKKPKMTQQPNRM